MEGVQVVDFKGIRNDVGRKFAGADYFNRCNNFVFDDIVGANKVKLPIVEFNSNTLDSIDGFFEFKYINQNSEQVTENIVVFGGVVHKGLFSTLVPIFSGLTAGARCDFVVLNDKMFIANGIDIIVVYNGRVVSEMGAPSVENKLEAGNLNGDYFYEMTYVIGGVESRSGARSNTINTDFNKSTLEIPIGPVDVTTRKIYRTTGGGSTLKLVVDIGDNITTVFVDDVSDGSLGADIIAVNDPMPIPTFITVVADKLVGGKVAKRPQRLYFTEPNKEFFTNLRNTTDVTTFGNDNTSIQGIEPDYNQLVVGSEKFLYLVNFITVSGNLSAAVKQTNENIGVKDGYSMINIPANEDFQGGIIFASTLNDIRLFNGNIGELVGTALDNLRSYNLSQVISATLRDDIAVSEFLIGHFFDYKYFLATNENIHVFDIRGQKWSLLTIKTENFSSFPNFMGTIDNKMYVGQKDEGIVEKMFTEFTYRGEEYRSKLTSNQVVVSTDLKYFRDFYFYYTTASECTLNIKIFIEGNTRNPIEKEVVLEEGSFSFDDFFELDFKTLKDQEDYQVIHINKYARWIEFEIDVIKGFFNFRGYKFMTNKVYDKGSE